MGDKVFSKTKLRLHGKTAKAKPEKSCARIEEMFPDCPPEVDDILFDVSEEPLFPKEKTSKKVTVLPAFRKRD